MQILVLENIGGRISLIIKDNRPSDYSQEENFKVAPLCPDHHSTCIIENSSKWGELYVCSTDVYCPFVLRKSESEGQARIQGAFKADEVKHWWNREEDWEEFWRRGIKEKWEKRERKWKAKGDVVNSRRVKREGERKEQNCVEDWGHVKRRRDPTMAEVVQMVRAGRETGWEAAYNFLSMDYTEEELNQVD